MQKIQDVSDEHRFGWYAVGDFVQVEGMLSAGMVVGIERGKLLIGYKNVIRTLDQIFLGTNCYKTEKPEDFNLSDLDWIYDRYPHLIPSTP